MELTGDILLQLREAVAAVSVFGAVSVLLPASFCRLSAAAVCSPEPPAELPSASFPVHPAHSMTTLKRITVRHLTYRLYLLSVSRLLRNK